MDSNLDRRSPLAGSYVRAVICATALIAASETLVGIGAIELDSDPPRPDTLVVDEALTDGLDELLTRALLGRANVLARSRAA